eukprot:3878863-Rhodomonas_salina.1
MDGQSVTDEPSHVLGSELEHPENGSEDQLSGIDKELAELDIGKVLRESKKKLLDVPLRPEDQGALVAGKDIHQLYFILCPQGLPYQLSRGLALHSGIQRIGRSLPQL